MAQWGPRKNLINTVKWFVEECYDQDVGLVLKTSIRKNNVSDAIETENRIKQVLSEYQDRKCKGYLLHGDMSEQELAGLYPIQKLNRLLL